jgi:uncharacterized protein (UPF0276 family)
VKRQPSSTGAPVGIGWRHPHYEHLLAERPPLAFLEVHSENFFAEGGAAPRLLERARADYAVSLHGVGLSLGSAQGLDPWHLDRLAALVERVDPMLVSDHASFARGPGLHANDLLPIAFSEASLELMVSHVQQVQERLRRPMLVENLSAYLRFAEPEMDEPEFFNRLARRSGCGLLLDVNNLVVNALNEGLDEAAAAVAACRWIDAIAPEIVGEIHLAGHARLPDGVVIDDHGSRVCAAVWQVYEHALAHCGALPSLIEWDTEVPALEILLAEAALARERIARSVPAMEGAR